jgi:CRISPR-associated endonuclease/helicase Cas3
VTLNVDAFEVFFEEVHGYRPFAWQKRLVEHVLGERAWPESIAAPTGTGKTSVIDVHAFVNAAAQEQRLSLPRRLVMTVNRRSLVDSHAEHAQKLAARLERAPAGSVTQMVADLLRSRAEHDGVQGLPLSVHSIRGGIPIGRDWRQALSACAVLCMTPDMWGSRVLFRGYGTSRWARSLEAGVLVRDTVLVLDEAHLNRQLELTARRIAFLDALATEELGVPGLQVVATTATPDTQGGVGVSPSDLDDPASGPTLAARLNRPKTVMVKETEVTRAQTEKLATVFVEELLAVEPSAQGGTAGCVVNTVALARQVYGELVKRKGVEESDVEMLVGGLAPIVAEEVVAGISLNGGHRPEDGRRPRFVVGTQALEVGLDVDLGALVTELAPGSALAQRFGRLNRHGLRSSGAAVVVAPQYDPKDTRVPYGHDELAEALAWVKRRAQDPMGVAASAIAMDPPPPEERRRVLYQRLEWPDVNRLARTSEDLAAAETTLPDHGEDLTLWLRDSFDEDAEASAVVRDLLPTETLAAARAADLTPPLDAETYRSSLRRMRSLAGALAAAHPAPLIVYRAGRATVLATADELQPGDTLVIEPWRAAKVHPNETAAHVWGKHVKELEDIYDQALERDLERSPDADNYWHVRLARTSLSGSASAEAHANTEQEDHRRHLFDELLRAAESAPAASAAGRNPDGENRSSDTGPGVTAPDGPDESLRLLLSTAAEALAKLGSEKVSVELPSGSYVQAATALGIDAPRLDAIASANEAAPGVLIDLVASPDGSEFLLLLRNQQPQQQDEARSEHARRAVRLADHVAAVTHRAKNLAAVLGLEDRLAHAVTRAAEFHDTGKAHPRFQLYLRRGRRGEALLAKSGYHFDPAAHRRFGLAGWRHEQLSAAVAWSQAGDLTEPELVTWLVGTSHGRGRAAFDQDCRSLYLPDPAADEGAGNPSPARTGATTWAGTNGSPDLGAAMGAAGELFDDGLWEEWCEKLSRRFGPWGLAYLEAVLRASDQTVSAEGR